jgi:hypothetical protein
VQVHRRLAAGNPAADEPALALSLNTSHSGWPTPAGRIGTCQSGSR